MFWLAYRCDGDPCVIIIKASTLVLARLKASMAVEGIDEHFLEGHELPEGVMRKIPASAVGHLLTGQEAIRILDALTKNPAKRPRA
jgi:hypothetical protein